MRLALFYLSMMAGYGPTSIQSDYPAFDSWSYSDDGTYIHNTTGKIVKKRPYKAVLQHHDPSAKGPVWVTFDDTGYLTRSSVRTLDIDSDQFYYVDESGSKVYITNETVVYDEEAEEFGYFCGLVWMRQTESSKTKSSKTDKANKRRPRK